MRFYGKLISIRFTDVYSSSHHFVPLINSCVYFGWSGVFGCNYVGQRYACYGWNYIE
ncbi:hypothetical protein Hanom_Chr00s000003g01605411 [Helianthus anomalus]